MQNGKTVIHSCIMSVFLGACHALWSLTFDVTLHFQADCAERAPYVAASKVTAYSCCRLTSPAAFCIYFQPL